MIGEAFYYELEAKTWVFRVRMIKAKVLAIAAKPMIIEALRPFEKSSQLQSILKSQFISELIDW